MSDADPTRTATQPRETLAGDRLCMQCLHPLVGRTIEADPQTGLRFVRCGECGTASGLFDYPVVAPWVRRFKTVAASTFLVVALALVVAIGGASTGLTAGFSVAAAEESAEAVAAEYARLGGTLDENEYVKGSYSQADLEWLGSDAGRSARRAALFSPAALLVFALAIGVGFTVLLPFLAMLGIVVMRRRIVERALVGALIPALGAGIAVAIHASRWAFTSGRSSVSWNTAVGDANSVDFAWILGLFFACYAAIVVATAPVLAGAVFRFILPPSDRRLVAWIWEWRGKSVPRD